MPEHKLRPPSEPLDADRLDRLRQIVPEAFADGEVDFDRLRDLLAPHLADGGPDREHFGLSWPGKRQARRLASQPSKGTLVPVPGQGVDEETTRNVFVEGDNLEVLKLLQKSYAGRVKLISIDPPYNTGNDFVYNDNFKQSVSEYLRLVRDESDDGKLLASNPRTSGRFHSSWLSMMYPRLVLARSLLRDDGVIFVTIDDNEVSNLRLLLDEVFGSGNFRSSISWQKKYSVSNNFKGIASIRDHILVYSKSDEFENGYLPRSEESRARYSNPDNDDRGDWKAVDYWNQASPEQRPNLVYDIKNPNSGAIVTPSKKAWKYSHDTYTSHVEENRLWWGIDGNNSVPALKLFLSEVRDGLIPHNWWPHEMAGHTDEAKKELEQLFPDGAPFDTPKPTRLLQQIIRVANVQGGDIVADFFAGSGSLAQAVYTLDASESHPSFLLVQLPEPISPGTNANKMGFKVLSDVAAERIRRASRTSKDEGISGDLGFKFYRLDQSHLKDWTDYAGTSVGEIEDLFAQQETPLVDGWTRPGLLTEVLLLRGYPLDSNVEPVPGLEHNEVLHVTTDAFGADLYVCLDNDVHTETIAALDIGPEDTFVCLDAALTDEDKVRLLDKGTLYVI